ncbi:calcium/sodium antiporter [Candidatus Parcubacteria bacterium]|jgi:cation:H+ antiporter|nr:calcium/sodium antiporter [Candidatus Parcubacteria bacterium]
MMIWLIVFAASLWMLIKSADYFTDYAEELGKLLKLPNFIVGVLIVAVGTSLPELTTSIFAVYQGEVEFLAGNVIGTVIVNILLGLGIAVLFSKRKAIFNWDIVSNDLPFFGAAIFLLIIALSDGKFNIIEACIFLVGYIVYIIYAYHIQKSAKESVKEEYEKQLKKEIKSEVSEIEKKEKIKTKKDRPIIKIVLFLVISLAVVSFSSKFVVDSVIHIAQMLGIGTSVIAATIVALGTSLPEILVATSAARRGNFDMVIGDIIGSNIFDLFVIFGAVGLFTELTISKEMFMLLGSFLVGAFFLMWLAFIDKKMTRTEALMFILIYFTFAGKLFNIF